MKATKPRRSVTSAATPKNERKPFISAYYIFFQEEKAKMAKTHKDMKPRERLKYIVSKWRKLDVPTRCIYEQNARDQVSHRKNMADTDTSSMDAGKQRAAHSHPRQRQYLTVQQQQAENDHYSYVSSKIRYNNSIPCETTSYLWECPRNMQQQSLFVARHTIPKINTSPRHTTVQEEIQSSSASNLLELSDFPMFCSSSSMSDCYESDNNTEGLDLDLSCWSSDGSYENNDDDEREEGSFSQLELSKPSNYKGNLQQRINRALAVTNSFRDDDFVNFVADLFGKCTN